MKKISSEGPTVKGATTLEDFHSTFSNVYFLTIISIKLN